jgi:hypothetical protein
MGWRGYIVANGCTVNSRKNVEEVSNQLKKI